MSNPRVFFDITINDNNAGRVVMELFADVVPKTVRLPSFTFLPLHKSRDLTRIDE